MNYQISTQDTTGAVKLWPRNNAKIEDGWTIRLVDTLPSGRGAMRWDEQVASLVREAYIEPIPEAVLSHQIRTWLITHGIPPSSIDAIIAGMPDGTPSEVMAKQIAQTAWEYAPQIRRDHALVAGFSIALGLTSEQVDQAFREASQL